MEMGFICVLAIAMRANSTHMPMYTQSLILGEGLEGEQSAFGRVGQGGVPEYTINLYPYKWWLEVDINYCAEGVTDYIIFYPADMNANPPTNPYYTG